MILEGKIPIDDPIAIEFAIKKIHTFGYRGDMVLWTNEGVLYCLSTHRIEVLHIVDNHVYYKLLIYEEERVMEGMRLHRWFIKLCKHGNGIDIIIDLRERTIPIVEAVV